MSEEKSVDLVEERSSNEDSDEDAPEDISLADAKKQAQERLKEKQTSIKHAKDLKKNKRRERAQQLLEQKETKQLKNFDKLPESVLNALATEDINEGEDIAQETPDAAQSGDKTTEEDLSEESEEEEELEGIDNISAHILTWKKNQSESKSQNGRDFLRNQLYGDRIKRVASSSIQFGKSSKIARPNAAF